MHAVPSSETKLNVHLVVCYIGLQRHESCFCWYETYSIDSFADWCHRNGESNHQDKILIIIRTM